MHTKPPVATRQQMCNTHSNLECVHRRSARLGRMVAALLVLSLVGALAACGSTVPSTSSASKAHTFELESPGLTASKELSARYVCAPDRIMPLKWGALPPKTISLAIVFFELTDIHRTPQGSYRAKITPVSAITDLRPTLRSIADGQLPHGAVMGHSRTAVCPATGTAGTYLVRVYALAAEVSAISGFSEKELLKGISPTALAVGSLRFHAERT